MVLCTAQARTQIRAENRFRKFCEYISEKTSATNGFEYIKVKFDENTQISKLIIDGRVKDKHIILVDDITTSGRTLTSLKKQLLEAGATSVDCFAIGMTV